MKLKKIMAFVLATGLMMSSMTVMAAATNIGDKATEPTERDDKSALEEGDTYHNTTDKKDYEYDGSKWVEKDTTGGGGTQTPDPSSPEAGDSTSSSSSTVSVSGAVSAPCTVSAPAPAAPKTLSRQDIINIVTRAETIALQATARDEGFADMVDMQVAAAKNMSAGEYYNNAAVETPGIEEATPVAQGGGIIINGVVTNMMATISKVDVAFVDSVRASVEGTVLNVVDVRFPAVEATINFYMPGVTADASIVAVQYVDGAWVDVEVAEVRADHVVLNLKQNGKVAFLAK